MGIVNSASFHGLLESLPSRLELYETALNHYNRMQFLQSPILRIALPV